MNDGLRVNSYLLTPLIVFINASAFAHADHDWTSDKGQRTGEGDWYKLAEDECEDDYEKGYSKSLIYVLYGEDLKEMGKEGKDIDWKYIDEDIDAANIVPWHFYEDHEKVSKGSSKFNI